MNLLSLIIIFLALVICGAVGYIAWELTSDKTAESDNQASAKGESPPVDDGDEDCNR